MGLFLIGVFPTINMIAIQSSDVSFHGRVFGLTNAANQLGSMVGPLAGGFVSSWIGIRPVFMLTGSILIVLGAYSLSLKIRAAQDAMANGEMRE